MIRKLVLGAVVTVGFASVVCTQDLREAVRPLFDPARLARRTDYAQDLRKAVTSGNVEYLNLLLDSGANVNTRFENQYTPIYFAHDPRVVELLIARGAKLNLRGSGGGKSPLEHAAEMHFRDVKHREIWQTIVDKLLAGGAEYTIDTAIYMNDIAFVKEWLDRDDSWVDKRQGAQSVSLRVAARAGRTEICRLLLEHKADPDGFEQGCGYPIMVDAVEHAAVVKLLIEYKANLRRRITWMGGRTGFWTIGDECTALHFAVERGSLESVKALLEAGLDPNAADDKGQTPLHLAIMRKGWAASDHLTLGKPPRRESFVKIIELLLEYDASLSFKDKSGETPLDWAGPLEKPTEVHRLLEKKAGELSRAYHSAMFGKNR